MNEKFLEVGDVMQILGISRSAAYKLMRQINSELEKNDTNVIRAKIFCKFQLPVLNMDRFDFVCFHFVEIGKVFLDGSSTIKKSAFLIGSFAMISLLT